MQYRTGLDYPSYRPEFESMFSVPDLNVQMEPMAPMAPLVEQPDYRTLLQSLLADQDRLAQEEAEVYEGMPAAPAMVAPQRPDPREVGLAAGIAALLGLGGARNAGQTFERYLGTRTGMLNQDAQIANAGAQGQHAAQVAALVNRLKAIGSRQEGLADRIKATETMAREQRLEETARAQRQNRLDALPDAQARRIFEELSKTMPEERAFEYAYARQGQQLASANLSNERAQTEEELRSTVKAEKEANIKLRLSQAGVNQNRAALIAKDVAAYDEKLQMAKSKLANETRRTTAQIERWKKMSAVGDARLTRDAEQAATKMYLDNRESLRKQASTLSTNLRFYEKQRDAAYEPENRAQAALKAEAIEAALDDVLEQITGLDTAYQAIGAAKGLAQTSGAGTGALDSAAMGAGFSPMSLGGTQLKPGPMWRNP